MLSGSENMKYVPLFKCFGSKTTIYTNLNESNQKSFTYINLRIKKFIVNLTNKQENENKHEKRERERVTTRFLNFVVVSF